jgi:hypothetical protein
VVAVTPSRVLIAEADEARALAPREVAPEAVAGVEELEPGHLAAVLELVTAAVPAPAPDMPRRPGARAAGAPAEPDAVDLLRKLGDLRDAGVLTEEEFTAKKAELLRRI